MALETMSQSVPTNSVESASPNSNPSSDAPKVESTSDVASQTLGQQTIDKAESAPSTPSDPSKDTKKPEDKADDKVGSKFAALTRKERQVVAKQEALKVEEAKLVESKAKVDAEIASERAKIVKEREEFQPRLKALEEFESLKKSNPLEAMKALGFSYEQITEIVLNEGKPTPEMEIERRTKELEDKFNAKLSEAEKARQEAIDKQAKEAEERQKSEAQKEAERLQAEEATAVQEFRESITDFIAKSNDNYELIATNFSPEEATDHIYAIVEEQYQRSLASGKPKVLSIGEASDMLESYLEKQLERNLATKKLKAKVTPPQAPKEESKANEPTASATQPKSKTLNNDMTASSLSSPAKTDEERMKRALAALEKF